MKDWEYFERIIFELLLDKFNLKEDELNKITKSKKDGGYDGIFIFPSYDNNQLIEFKTLFEAKLRNNLKKDLPLQDFSKAVIISMNMAAQRIIIATNLHFSTKTIKILEDYSYKTGLKIDFLTIDTIYEWFIQHINDIEYSENLYHLLENSYDEYKKNYSTKIMSMNFKNIIPQVIDSINLFSQKRKEQASIIIEQLKNNNGTIIINGDAGTGKSYFIKYISIEMNKKNYNTAIIDLKYCRTPRVLFSKILTEIWKLPTDIILSMTNEDFDEAIKYIGDSVLDTNIKSAVLNAFKKNQEEFSQQSDIFNYYLVEYLYKVFCQVNQIKSNILLFTNLNYTSPEVLDFLITFNKRFEKGLKMVFELRTSFYIDDLMESAVWEAYVRQIRGLSSVIHVCELETLYEDEYSTYINSLIDKKLNHDCISEILSKTGNNFLVISTYISILINKGINFLPDDEMINIISDCPYSHFSLIELLINSLSEYSQYYSGLFFITSILNGKLPLDYTIKILGCTKKDIDYILKTTNIYTLSNKWLYINHGLYLDAMSSFSYIGITYEQEIADKLLDNECLNAYITDSDEREMCIIQLYEVKNIDTIVIERSVDFSEHMHRNGQYNISKKYAEKAIDKYNQMRYKSEKMEWYYIKAIETFIMNEIYIQSFDKSKFFTWLEKIEECFENRNKYFIKFSDYDVVKIKYYLIKNRIYHLLGDYKTSMEIIKSAQKFMMNNENISDKIKGSVWSEYAIAIKENYTLDKSLRIFREGRKQLPHQYNLLFSELTHLSEKYSYTNTKRALKCLNIIQTFEEKLTLSEIFHNRVNIMAMQIYNGNYEEARINGKNIIKETYSYGLLNEEARCLNLSGCIHYISGDNKKALQYLSLGKERLTTSQNAAILWPILVNIANVQLKCGMNKKALINIENCINILEKSYSERINHLTIKEKHYPKLFAGIICLLYGLLHIKTDLCLAESADKNIAHIFDFVKIPVLSKYYDNIYKSSLKNIFENTPYLQNDVVIIKT